jgi:hypothetical protein
MTPTSTLACKMPSSSWVASSRAPNTDVLSAFGTCDVLYAYVRLTIASEDSANPLPRAAVPFTGTLHVWTESHHLEHETRYLYDIHQGHRCQLFLVVRLITRYVVRRVGHEGLLESWLPKGFRAMALAGCYNDHLSALCYCTMVTASPTAREHWAPRSPHARLGHSCRQLLVLTSMGLSPNPKPLEAAQSNTVLLPGYTSRCDFGDDGPGPGCLSQVSSSREQTV